MLARDIFFSCLGMEPTPKCCVQYTGVEMLFIFYFSLTISFEDSYYLSKLDDY